MHTAQLQVPPHMQSLRGKPPSDTLHAHLAVAGANATPMIIVMIVITCIAWLWGETHLCELRTEFEL